MIPNTEAPDFQFEILCGKEFARGMHRSVHDVKGHPNVVMKVNNNTTFANWNEYLVSSALQGRAEPVAQLMGNVSAISATGKYLIMERLQDINRRLSGIQYPVWLNDYFKPSAYGLTSAGTVKVRDYGTLKLADVLSRYNPRPDGDRSPRIVDSGQDQDYLDLQGEKICMGTKRTVYSVKGYPNHVLKVCNESHKANRIEFLIYSALLDMNADEENFFGILECSRSGKYLIMERLSDLPPNSAEPRPQSPWWLIDQSDASFGITVDGNVKIRSYNKIKLGDVLAQAPLRRFG